MTGASSNVIREVGEGEIAACYDLMRQLRPHLASPEEFAIRWKRQTESGYRLFAVWSDATPRALAGFRLMENLIHGRFLYVDDLVSEEGWRRHGHGARLLDRLKEEARAAGCRKLVLDTGLDNVLAHRFYYRQGLLARALRFNVELAQDEPAR